MPTDNLRDLLLRTLTDAYEDAGLRGLCAEGRWEAAVAAVQSLPLDLNVQSRAAASSPLPDPPTIMHWKPDNYSQVSPYLVVDGAAGTIDFLVDVFGAERLRQFPAPDGRVLHAEVRIGDSVIMIADGNEGWPPVPAHVHMYVPDVDAAYSRALEAGAESVQPPVRKDDEDRRGGVRDAGGTTWWIATREA